MMRRSLRWLAIGALALIPGYAAAYAVARASHRLVHYESNCIARGNLEGHARDSWTWPYRCSELRHYFEVADVWEVVFEPMIAIEELARGSERDHTSVCTPAIPTFPSQGFSRPAWCAHE